MRDGLGVWRALVVSRATFLWPAPQVPRGDCRDGEVGQQEL